MLAGAPLVEALTRALLERDEILEAYLFGPTARGDARAHSDVDIAVFVDAARVAESPFGYEAEVATAAMGAIRATHVDVVVLNRAPPLLYHRVLRDGVQLFSRDLRATTGREGEALSRYRDWVPQLREIDEALSARIRRGEFGR